MFSLPAGAAADQELCIDQAVVFIEDAIKVCGGSLLTWSLPCPFVPYCHGVRCLEFSIDTMADT